MKRSQRQSVMFRNGILRNLKENQWDSRLVSGQRLLVVPNDAFGDSDSSLPQAEAKTEGRSDKKKRFPFFKRFASLRAGLRQSGRQANRVLSARLKADALTRTTALMMTTLLLSAFMFGAQQRVNADAAIAAKFDQRVTQYMKLRQKALAGLAVPKNTDSPEKIADFQKQLAGKVRDLRPQAKRGELFTPEVVGLLQRLVATAMRGRDGALIRTSFQRAEPVQGGHLDVNAVYPDGLPLQSMPPSLLLNLPRLPKELEYRFVGRELILRDTQANLILDVIPDLRMPQTK